MHKRVAYHDQNSQQQYIDLPGGNELRAGDCYVSARSPGRPAEQLARLALEKKHGRTNGSPEGVNPMIPV